MADQAVASEHVVEPSRADDDVLRIERISKRFGATQALRDISIHLRKGEVLGLLGDNGAGKSTVIKILSGFHAPDTGSMWCKGQPYTPKSVDDARTHGLDTVFQDLALIDELTVYQNLFLRREPRYSPIPFINRRRMKRETRAALDQIGINIPSIDVPVARLSGGQRQAIAVARTISGDADILLLDEPLAAMGAKEGAMILDLIARLKAEGRVSIIMILHNYVHVLAACDRVNLIQDGVISFDKRTSETSVEELTDIVVEEYRRARMAGNGAGPAGGAGAGRQAAPGARAAGGPGGGEGARGPAEGRGAPAGGRGDAMGGPAESPGGREGPAGGGEGPLGGREGPAGGPGNVAGAPGANPADPSA